ncbi:MAG: hypothetical protein HOA72_19025 [Desulfobacula sp.]|jgi:hypothetical protein|uniref:hypothetical protein n=1 Tax=Desulfobacula sp. TaxID=2593537 RepID=UPI002A04A34A|nr:hypothetical protein [Desulfobacula sp.]MBT6751020.1 hypothetical protein [Desulfobacula sp.]
MNKKSNKLVILTSYFKEESYGLLGPQMAATIINAHTPLKAIVVGVTHEDDPRDLKSALNHYFGDQQKLLGFSSLGGRPDLFDLARVLKQEGAVTILAGPQAGPDYKGEFEWQSYSHRFKGVSDCFSFALHGPAQQIIPILSSGFDKDISRFAGVLSQDINGQISEIPSIAWDDAYLSDVDWQTLYGLKNKSFKPLKITTAQVLQQIGCQHAARPKKICIDYPWAMQKKGVKPAFVTLYQQGCSFCDVAKDKGYLGGVSDEALKTQLLCLPEDAEGRKIPFELINESPLPKLSKIFKLAEESGIQLSQINLTLRADYLIKGIKSLEETLEIAAKKNVRILLSSIGFESFDDTILKNLNKGIDKQTNLDAIKAIRKLKSRYPAHLGYLKEEGANNGFIHPTPWDNKQISHGINKVISMYQLSHDILPRHSTPLIIHHASGLADWIREIEVEENIQFQRVGTTIGWWQSKEEFLL